MSRKDSPSHLSGDNSTIEQCYTSQSGTGSASDVQGYVDRVEKMGLPKFSDRVSHALDSGQIITEIDRCIEESAYFLMRHGDIKNKSEFAAFGQLMYNRYPCINFSTRVGDTTPWVITEIV
jgi:hypothetical protein